MNFVVDNLKKNIIGDVRCVTANIGYNLGGRERLLKPELAGGALLDLGIYSLTFADIFLTDPEICKEIPAGVYPALDAGRG